MKSKYGALFIFFFDGAGGVFFFFSPKLFIGNNCTSNPQNEYVFQNTKHLTLALTLTLVFFFS